jgi:LEA14-like dessication related protein
MKRDVLLCLVPLVFTSCLGYREVVLKDVLSVDLRRIDASGIDVTVEVVIDNPNGYRIKARDPDVDLFINGIGVGKAGMDSVIVLEKRSTRTYAIPMHVGIEHQRLVSMVMLSALNGKTQFSAKGVVTGQAGPFKHRFPFEVEEVLELDP